MHIEAERQVAEAAQPDNTQAQAKVYSFFLVVMTIFLG